MATRTGSASAASRPCRSCAARTTRRRASQNAIAGGNEQQQVTLASFSATTQSFQISLGGSTSTVLGLGGAAVDQRQRRGGDQRHPGLRGRRDGDRRRQRRLPRDLRRTVGGHRRPAALDRQLHGRLHLGGARAGQGRPRRCRAGRRARRVTVGPVTDTGYTLLFGGTLSGVDVDRRSRSPAPRARPARSRSGSRAVSARSAPARPRRSPASARARSTTRASRSRSAARWRTSTSRRSASRSRAAAASWARPPAAARSRTRASP